MDVAYSANDAVGMPQATIGPDAAGAPASAVAIWFVVVVCCLLVAVTLMVEVRARKREAGPDLELAAPASATY